MYIENDLKAVDEALRVYYHLKPEHNCSECGKTILPTQGRSVEQIVDGTLKNYGRKLCWSCMVKEINRRKEAERDAAESVSGGACQQGA